MINKYGLVENVAHVDQYTLLDQNNFIPTWDTGDGEKAEVSTALLRLRNEYDAIRRKALTREEELHQLK